MNKFIINISKSVRYLTFSVAALAAIATTSCSSPKSENQKRAEALLDKMTLHEKIEEIIRLSHQHLIREQAW